MSIVSSWRNLRTGIRGVRFAFRLVREARLLRRAIELRNAGKLEEALVVCRRAIDVTAVPSAHRRPGALAIPTLAYHEIAAMLERGDLAREALEKALADLEQRERGTGLHEEDLLGYEREIRRRLDALRAA